MKPKALDLFCGAGGATKGLQMAGFHVTGVDLVASKNYCGDAFIKADALEVDLEGYDLIWASPPCQHYSVACANRKDKFPDLLPVVRDRLVAAGTPWIIENVPGAPMRADVTLCGRMFGLQLIRHRLFECSFSLKQPQHQKHDGTELPVYGNGTPSWHLSRFGRCITVQEKRSAMNISWMTGEELAQAIPPDYSCFLARQLEI